MAVIYLFDSQKRLKKPVRDVVEIIHREGEYEAEAQITAAQKPEYGDFFGFRCADGRFRMFLITRRETSDETGICTITGPDAALQELDSSVMPGRITLNGKTAEAAALDVLNGTGWQLGQLATETQETLYLEDAYYSTRWTAIKKIAAQAKMRAVPYYEFATGQIVGRKIDLARKKPVFRGLIITRRQGAKNIIITEEGTPYRRVFALGKIISSTEPPEQVTIADAVWSKANGDPVDKPAGQDYIEIPGAAGGEYVFEDKQEEDPARLQQKAYDDLLSKQKPKASGIANVSDTEYMPGYRHKAAHMYDLAVVRTENGDTVATTIINIDRYHVQKHLTKIEIGEEKESDLDAQIARLKAQEADTARRAGGAGAGAKEAKEMVLEAERKITLMSQEIELRAMATDVLAFENQTITQFNEIGARFDAVGKQLVLYAKQTDVDNIGNTVKTLSSTVEIQAGKIAQKVSAGDIASEINLTPQTALIKAEKINLEGYVKANTLEAEVAKINKFFTGTAQASSMDINSLTCQTAQITNVSLINYDAKWHTISMGEKTMSCLGKAIESDVDLQHSHSVNVGDDGTITFGEVSSAGGSFNIADTKVYKDGVSAAAEKVTLSEVGWIGKQNQVKASNGKIKTVLLPTFYFTVDNWNSLNNTYVRTKYKDSEENEVEAGYAEVNASSVYQAGFDYAKSKTTVHYKDFKVEAKGNGLYLASVRIIARIDGSDAASGTATYQFLV